MTVAEKTGMDGAVALRSLTLRNVLSFGAEAKVELGPLNVLIGPNGCGKSNLMDVIALLKAAATGELSDEFRGGAEDWVWNGAEKDKAGVRKMEIVSCWHKNADAFTHSMGIVAGDGTYSILRDEKISRELTAGMILSGMSVDSERGEKEFTVRREGHWSDLRQVIGDKDRISLLNPAMPIHRDQSGGQDEISAAFAGARRRALSDLVKDAQVYRGRQVGRVGELGPLHLPSRTDGPIDRISEDLGNFALVLNRVRLEREDDVVKALREIYEDARGLDVRVAHNRMEVILKEKGGNVPASRMSDGVLNWLFLLTILLDPNPPALVCIDEPETGLHPDLLTTLSEMLIDASSRMQLIVTTHSDMLVDCFTDDPEFVVVCDKEDGVTQMNRLRAKDFEGWKEEGLGMAWASGAIGGKRW